MDTVQGVGDKVKVVFDGQMFKSDGKTILGADNKSGVTTLLANAVNLKKESLDSNILYFFPVREEAGIMGSSFFVFPEGKIKYVFNVDNGDTPGVFVYRSLGYQTFKIEISGKSAHAAKNYNLGKDAIKAAGRLLCALPTGKNEKEGWTMNIGKICGGSAINVVCDKVVLDGELRAFKVGTMSLLKNKITNICSRVGEKTGCKISLLPDKASFIAPFHGDRKSEISQISSQAALAVGLKPVFKEVFSTSDANSFSAKGFSVISVSRGGENGHSNKESLKLKDLIKASVLVLQLAKL